MSDGEQIIVDILKDYRDAEARLMNGTLIALWGFVDDATFITKSGALGLVYRVRGVDYECLDVHPEHRHRASLRASAQAARLETFRVYQYLITVVTPHTRGPLTSAHAFAADQSIEGRQPSIGLSTPRRP